VFPIRVLLSLRVTQKGCCLSEDRWFVWIVCSGSVTSADDLGASRRRHFRVDATMRCLTDRCLMVAYDNVGKACMETVRFPFGGMNSYFISSINISVKFFTAA